MTTSLAVFLCCAFSVASYIGYRIIWLPFYRLQILLRLAKCFSRAIELRAGSHYGLSNEVVDLSMQIVRLLKLPRKVFHRVQVAGFLRDVGLSAVPYKVLNKVEDWTAADESVYARHPEVGSAMLEVIPALAPYAEVVRDHHRSFESNPSASVESRILAAAADYCWQERRVGSERALKFIEQSSGRTYDPVIVDALKQVIMI